MALVKDMYTACTTWLNDWMTAYPPEQLIDSWDLGQWMDSEMIDAIQVFVLERFKQSLTKIDDSISNGFF